jgi:enoyl-[acyl-carrier protein] reductase II
VDAIVAEGSESGGYINIEEVTTLALVPQVVDALRLPVIAAGGIADARGLVAALALGAVGVQMGTRFLATKEYKRALVLAKDTDTTVVRGRGTAHRDLKKELIERVRGEGKDPSVTVKEMLAQFEEGRLREAPRTPGAWAVYSAGQSAGLVREVLPVEEIVRDMMREAIGLMASLPERLNGHLRAN